MSNKKIGLLEFIKFYKENGKIIKLYPLRNKLRTQLTLNNIEISKLDNKSKLFKKRVDEFNDLMVYHYAGKWYATEAMKNKNKYLWKKSFFYFKKGLKLSYKMFKHLKNNDISNLIYDKPKLKLINEIKYFNDIPLVPEITPIVILEGSSYQMGYQYANQLRKIYGDWIIKRYSDITFNNKQLDIIKKWELEHKKHTPEIIDFVNGWVDHLKENNVKINYYQILNLWIGHKSPAKSYLNSEAGIPDLPPLACTAISAWNSATSDGKLVVGATGDHDMSYQLTIVMYPNDGIPLVFTTFEATGTLPTVGPNWFFGHPGMNKKGLAYVHHGGGPKLLEPIKSWGYGIRRGASVLHNLRYKKTAKEAQKQELNWPIGDIGNGDQATVGGFYADSNYGYIIESRKKPYCIRESGILGETDYLFSNNSVMHPDAITSQWMNKIKELWIWDKEGGWRPKKPKGMTKSLFLIFKWFTGKLKTDELMSRGMNFAYWNSYNRNIFLNKMGKLNYGKITPGVMKKIYRTSGTMPKGNIKKLKKEYIKSGKWGKITAAHSSNALVVVMKPYDGLYSLCTGPTIRGAAPISPDLAISIYNERNSYWDILLLDTPKDMVLETKNLAKNLIEKVEKIYSTNKVINRQLDIYTELQTYLSKFDNYKIDTLDNINTAIRYYTKIHVISRQFINFYTENDKFDY